MGIFNNLFKKNNSKENGVFYRANLFQKNIASQIEFDSLEIAISFQHSLVNISEKIFKVKTLNGKEFSFPIRFSEKNSFTTTNIGKFENGNDFRLIQPIGLSLDMAKKKNNALGGFTLGSVNPNGWAVHFFLTDKEDVRQFNVLEKGKNEQIERLISGSLMAIQANLHQNFLDYTKRLLNIIDHTDEIISLENGQEILNIMRQNINMYNTEEKNKIKRSA